MLVGFIGARRSWLEGCIAVVLTSWSYLLVHFGAEARGYSLAIFFALLAWYALQQFEKDGRGFGQLSYGAPWYSVFSRTLNSRFVLRAYLAWTLWRLVRYRSKWRQGVLDLFALFTVPGVLLLVFYFVAIRGMEVGGGPEYQLEPLLIETASYMLADLGVAPGPES